MASGKRASMREGPLAALFRKTEEEGGEPREGERPPEAPPGEEARERAPETSAERPSQPATAAAREREGGEPEAEAPPERTPVPSPRERLRHAFSADIPENVMDAGAATEAPASGTATGDAPPDAYARSGAELYGQPATVGAPVIRVVGVGGAGVNAINRMV